MIDTIKQHLEAMDQKAFSSSSFKVSELVGTHLAMKPVIHRKAASKKIDVEALTYTFYRLPVRMYSFEKIYLYSSRSQLQRRVDFRKLTPIHNPARRTMVFANGKNLYVIMRSISDMYDFLSLLSIFQIEINKLKDTITQKGLHQDSQLKTALALFEEDFNALSKILTPSLLSFLFDKDQKQKDYRVHVYYDEDEIYKKTKIWADHIIAYLRKNNLLKRRVYLISSNTHSIANILGGYALKIEDKLVDFTYLNLPVDLQLEVAKVQRRLKRVNYQNLLYYLLKKYLATHTHLEADKIAFEEQRGIVSLQDNTSANLFVHVIDLAKIRPSSVDPRLQKYARRIKDAIIINYDYPFGAQSEMVLRNFFDALGSQVKGLFVMGKAGSLVGNVGDIMIPNAFYDRAINQHYEFTNIFRKSRLNWSVFAQTVRGINGTSTAGTLFLNDLYFTFLNEHNIHLVEMEAIPYLRAIARYCGINFKVHHSVNLTSLPFALGMIYYVSDTPYREGRTLSENLSYWGVDSTYAVSLSVLEAIFNLEKK